MVFAICREHSVERTHRNAIVNVVGIKPDFWNTLGRLSIAGPVSEFTAIDILPNIPIVPLSKLILFRLVTFVPKGEIRIYEYMIFNCKKLKGNMCDPKL
jgi:hypothetical protein